MYANLSQLVVSQPTWITPIPRHNRLHPTMLSKVAEDARYETQAANKRAMMARRPSSSVQCNAVCYRCNTTS